MTPAFRSTAAQCGVLTASVGLTYTVTFALYVREGYQWAQWISSVALLAGALLSLPVILAVYDRLRAPELQFAQLGLLFGVYGAIGAAAHAAFDIAVLANPPTSTNELPNQIDPRGFATFAATALALAVFGALILRAGGLPRPVGILALAGSACLLIVYLGRLIALDPNAAAVKPFALLYGLIIGPAYYLLVARALWSASAPDSAATTADTAPAAGTSTQPATPASSAPHVQHPVEAPAADSAGDASDESPDETRILPDRGNPVGPPGRSRVAHH
jgi:hypothetical protein